MSYTVTLQLPDEMLHRYEYGASAARKNLETFMVERLGEAILPLVNESYSSIDDELTAMAQADDKTLWDIARSHLPNSKQRRYDALLEKNSQSTLTNDETQMLHKLGEEARHLTLKKAHAYMLLKWRGHAIPTPDGLAQIS